MSIAAAASACGVTMLGLLHSFRKHLHKPPITPTSSQKNFLQPPFKLPCSPFHPSSIHFNSPTCKYPFFPLAVSPLITSRSPSSTTIAPSAKHRSSRKVNIRCRFGGKLMPRLSDGALHYAGGRTRITDFRRDTTLQELYSKMEDINGGPAVICYKLPDQSLDSLVSISSAEDLDNMLDEYDNLKETSSCAYPRLHVFLFPLSNRENYLAEFKDVAFNGSGLSYIKEVNGATKAAGYKSYKNDGDQEGTTSMLHVDDRGDGNGNNTTSISERQRFLVYSSINDKINVAQEPQSQNHRLFGKNILEISASNSILKNQDTRNVAGPSSIDSYFGCLRHTRGNDNTSMPKHSRFLAHSNINDEINMAPQIINPPNDVPYVLPIFEEPHHIHNITHSSFTMAHEPQSQNYQPCGEICDMEISPSNSIFKNQEPWNVAGPSNIDSNFGHLRHTRGNDNTSMSKHPRFLAHSNINDEINVAPQIINPPNDVPYVLPIYNEPHQIHNITHSSFTIAHEPQSQNYQPRGEICDMEISSSNSIFKNQEPWNVVGPSNIDSNFGHLRHTRDFLGNDNTLMSKHPRFLAHSNINDEVNVAPQIINLPNDVPHVLPTYEEPHQIHSITRSSFAMAHESQLQNYQSHGEICDMEISPSNSIFENQEPWNVAGLSNIDSYFGHLRHRQDMGTYEEDENLCNIVELVESVLQSP